MLFKKDKQHWLRSKIPTTFTDVDYLIEDLTFECLIYFWENGGEQEIYEQCELFTKNDEGSRDALNVTQIEFINEKRKAFKIYEELRDAYLWATDRKTRQLSSSNSDLVYDLDTKHLSNIIRWRKHLWS